MQSASSYCVADSILFDCIQVHRRRNRINVSLIEQYIENRHSRESGNPLLFLKKSKWIPAFAGMTK